MKVAPSVLSSNFNHLADELAKLSTADFIHLDIMDGHFVPNISFGPDIAKQIHDTSRLEMDIHLMVTDPLKWVHQFAFEKTKYITIHVEANEVEKTLGAIAMHSIGRGISLRPRTRVDQLLPYLDEVDLVLVMTVEPGFGGQAFMPEMLDKVKALVELRKKHGYHYVIEVDGGITDETIQACKDAGVDVVVSGSYIVKSDHPQARIKSLR